MVNFFEHQQQAKRNTTLLVVLFIIAFASLVGLTALITAAVLGGVELQQNDTYQLHWPPIALAALVVAAGILLTMLVKWLQLRPGGHVVAEQLGGVPIAPDTQDPLQRRVLNVVEEMAIAANMPVPTVYILAHESSINAFAAGYETKDAVIGLTQGAIETFSREQLQAVVAHEFSHILNGDMRLNIRLIAALAGVLVIAHGGRILMYSGNNRSRHSQGQQNLLPLLGITLMVIGFMGVLFGNLIKAAVSRQREYLADAAAVQFTRNPNALGEALQQIGARQQGSRIKHKNADEAAHLFFGQALSSWFTLTATHPPLAKRIKRVMPHWDGRYPEPQQAMAQQLQTSRPTPSPVDRFAQLALPLALLEQVRAADHAPNVIQQLLQGDEAIRSLNPEQQLALVELAMPALRQLSETERQNLLSTLQQQAEQQNLFHWCLCQLVARQLDSSQRFNRLLKQADPTQITLAALQQAEQQQPIQFDQLERALNTCQRWSPQQKQQLVQRWFEVVNADQHISTTERTLVVTLCACIGAPLPTEL